MNPLTNMKNVTKLSEQELQNNSKSSWHDQYRDSAWIFIGGLPYDLTEGDIICVFSQYGEVVNLNLIRDKDSGKSKGFCFLCYEDQRSTVLAVDNFNGIKVLNRILRVDHVSEYKIPKEGKKTDEETKKLYNEGCAPKAVIPIIKNPLMEDLEYRRETLADQIQADIKLPTRLPIHIIKKETDAEEPVKVKTEKTIKKKKKKKSGSEDEDKSHAVDNKKQKKKKNHKKQSSISESDSESEKYSIMKRKSKSKEGNIKMREGPESIENMKSRSRSQSVDKNEKQRSRSRRSRSRENNNSRSRFRRSRSRENDDSRSRSRIYNQSRSGRKQPDARKYDKHRNRSRS